ncbi:SigE family RNA polymerase sigma factor [Myceligenerans xiligouense]|uniref:SigE family RNA polymerase sigma factor n=1 Tax=Myceligenerans xiligouense TaxID=253184 RepID=UPI001FE85A6C|nr:SigE family RNA polymerase sigma factor [Myceligenerans xiligouense]
MSLVEDSAEYGMPGDGMPEGVAAAQGAAASSRGSARRAGAAPVGVEPVDAGPVGTGPADQRQEHDGRDAVQGPVDHRDRSGDAVASGRVGAQIRHAAARGSARRPESERATAGGAQVTDKNAEFTEFMRSARDPLHRMAFLLCGDRHRAEELTQQTFERCYRHWHKARQGEPLVYARRILANLRIDTWRRTRREVLAGPEDLLNAPAAGSESPRAGSVATPATRTVEDRDAVVRALLQLPLKQRRVVVMRHLLDLSETEVSRELGMPLGTVKSTASRGLTQLRTILEARGGAR